MGILVDIIGKKFYKLTVLSREPNDKNKRAQWLCQCKCGNKTIVSGKRLRSGHTKSCGCIRDYDISGQKIGRLTLLEKVQTSGWTEKRMAYKCRCECGTEKVISIISLTSGKIRSCGCYHKEHKNDLKLNFGEAAFNSVYSGYIRGAKKRNLEFNLSKEECLILFKSNCHYCDIEPSNKKKNTCGEGIFIYNGIDRKNNNDGYIKTNVVPCCKFCNFAKNRWKIEDFLKWLEKIKNKIL